MLILLIRIAFVIFATLAGHNNGTLIYDRLFEGGMPTWFGTAMGFGIAVTLIAAEQAFRRKFTRSLVGFLVGLAGGLLLSFLILLVVRMVLQDETLYRVLDVPIALLTVYLVIVTVVRNVDRWRVILPFVELHAERVDSAVAAVDVHTLADGRLIGLMRSGALAQRVLIHRVVTSHWELEAVSGDAVRVARAGRALENLRALRELGSPTVEIDETEIPNVRDATDTVLRLCRLETARLVTSSVESARRAAAEGVNVVDLAALAIVLNPPLRPGDPIEVLIEKTGDGKDQGVGKLDDGSLVVVTGAADKIGKRVTATILRMHQSGNGRMIFAE